MSDKNSNVALVYGENFEVAKIKTKSKTTHRNHEPYYCTFFHSHLYWIYSSISSNLFHGACIKLKYFVLMITYLVESR